MLILLLAGVLNILPTSGRSTYGIAGPEQTGFYLFDSIIQKNLDGGLGRTNAYFSARIGPRHEHAGHFDARHPLFHIWR